MSTGLIFCFLGAISFGVLGSVSKIAERRKCNASAFLVSLFLWATVAMLVWTATMRSGFHLPVRAIGVAPICGICAAVAYFAFQSVIPIGKVTVGWLMMNLSACVPAMVAIWLQGDAFPPQIVCVRARRRFVAFSILGSPTRRTRSRKTARRLKKEQTHVAVTDAGHSPHEWH